MKSPQLLTKGGKRNKGPPKRKLPSTAGGLEVIYQLPAVKNNVDNRILWRTVLTEWYCAMRMGEYLPTGKANANRHPLHAGSIEPLVDGAKADWVPDINGVSASISCSKTDWRNQGGTRPHSRVPAGSPNEHMCVMTELMDLRESYSSKFIKGRDAPFARWRNGGDIARDMRRPCSDLPPSNKAIWRELTPSTP